MVGVSQHQGGDLVDLSAPTFEAPAEQAAEAPLPEHPRGPDIPRAETLLRSASLLLARGEQTGAAHALHVELARELGHAPPPPPTSHQHAEDAHRELSAELARQRARSCPPLLRTLRSRHLLARRVPQWLAWASICGIILFLFLRFGYSLYARRVWQHQHPDGPWISRYYSKRNFEDYLLTRYDVAIDYTWGRGAPAEAMDRDHWSALWDTCFVVKKPTRFRAKFTADDAGKVILDGKTLVKITRSTSKPVTFNVKPGTYHLRVEYQERRKGAKVKLQGIDFAGNDKYTFQRPRLEGEQVFCDGKP